MTSAVSTSKKVVAEIDKYREKGESPGSILDHVLDLVNGDYGHPPDSFTKREISDKKFRDLGLDYILRKIKYIEYIKKDDLSDEEILDMIEVSIRPRVLKLNGGSNA